MANPERSWTLSSTARHSYVTRNGTPIGELIPLRRRRAVTREQFAAMSANAPFVDPERFRADLDAVIDTSLRDPYA